MTSDINELLVATHNAGKVAEIKELLKSLDIQVHYLDTPKIQDRAANTGFSAPPEDADSFAGNARIKADYAAQVFGMPVIADDSGLCVDALNGAPGVQTARYGGIGLSDKERYLYLLNALANETNRSAAFVCVICLVIPGNENVYFFKGSVAGEIVSEPVGTGGFGYDPVFYYPPATKSFADMDKAEKNQVSHRAKALSKLVAFLKNGTAA